MSIKKLALLLAVIAATCIVTARAQAAATRTWVSGTGTNNTQCSRTQPCQTFAQALAVTASSGEIDCLDPGNFGTLNINIPVTIDCEGVSNGGVQVTTPGEYAFSINATGPVNLIGLDINGTNVGSSGVAIGGASVTVRNCKIYGFTVGLGLYGGTLVADNVFVINNSTGIFENPGSAVSTNMSVRNSNISNNQFGIVVNNFGTHAGATIEQTTLAFSSEAGLSAQNPGAVAVIGGSTVVNNTVGVSTSTGGTIYSLKNNQIGGNGTDGTPLTAYPGGPLN